MSRHRNVRNLDYDDYADDYEYGMSYEEETAMSPSMREFMYRRRESEEGYNEEEDYYYDEKERYDEGGEEEGRRKGSRSGVSPRKSVILNGLSEAERGLLFSGMDYVGSVVGYDSFPEEEVMRLLVKYRFEAEKVLAVLLGDAKEEEVGAKEEKKKREEEIPFAAASSSSSVSVSTSKVEKKKEKDFNNNDSQKSHSASLKQSATSLSSFAVASSSLSSSSSERSAVPLKGGLGSVKLGGNLSSLKKSFDNSNNSSSGGKAGGVKLSSLSALKSGGGLGRGTGTLGRLGVNSSGSEAGTGGSARLGGNLGGARLGKGLGGASGETKNIFAGIKKQPLQVQNRQGEEGSKPLSGREGESDVKQQMAVGKELSKKADIVGSIEVRDMDEYTREAVARMKAPPSGFARVLCDRCIRKSGGDDQDNDEADSVVVKKGDSDDVGGMALVDDIINRMKGLYIFKPYSGGVHNTNSNKSAFVVNGKHIFAFDCPSPDDIVLGKRAGGGTSEASKGESQGTKKPGVGKKAAKAAKYAEKEANSGSNIDFDMAAMGIGPKTPIDTKLKQRLADPGGGSSGGGSGRSSTNVSPKISSPKVKRKNIDVKEAYRKRQGQHVHLNLVVIGHVDAGKSTMMGHLLYLLGEVDKRSMHRYENDSKKMGKSSFAFAWVLDETESERSRGVTVDVGTSYFETPTKKVTLLDAPGHKDFIPNMITGAAQADVGILVVNAVTGEFEAGFDSGGQTREHGLLARSLGVNQLIVAVNKLDMVNWSQPRFEDIVSSLKPFLKQIGFKSKNVSFIPCSGLTGVNLVKNEEAELKKWYTGKTLIEQIDCFEEPVRNVDLPFRFSVGDIYKGPTGGLWVSGKTESGHIQIGDNVAIMPTKANPEFGTVKNIEMRNEPVDWVASGDSASLQLVGVDPACINTGYILCAPENPIPVAIKIRARVIVFDIDIPLTKGNPVVFHTQCLDEPAIVSKLVSLLNKTTGEVIKDRPRALPSGCTAIVEIKLHRLVCLELYQDNKTLGRFMLRAGSQTVAAGIVTDILK